MYIYLLSYYMIKKLLKDTLKFSLWVALLITKFAIYGFLMFVAVVLVGVASGDE